MRVSPLASKGNLRFPGTFGKGSITLAREQHPKAAHLTQAHSSKARRNTNCQWYNNELPEEPMLTMLSAILRLIDGRLCRRLAALAAMITLDIVNTVPSELAPEAI